MRASRIFIAVIAVLMLAVPLLSVDVSTDAAPPEYTVTFNTNSDGNAYIDVSSMTTVDGKISDLPIPVWKGHTFTGWYTGLEADSEIVSERDVYTEDTTIYAHWKTNENRYETSSGIDFSDRSVIVMTGLIIGALVLIVFAALLRLGTRRR